MKNEYRLEHCVRYSEVDRDYRMRLDHIVTHFQDITGLHSKEMEIDGKTMRARSNAFWVLAKLKLRIHALPDYEDRVQIETWPSTAGGVKFTRDYTVSRDGQALVSCISEWCTLDCDTGRPRRVDSVHYPLSMPHRQDRSDAGAFLRIRETVEEADFSHSHRIAFTDLDTNRHTNNASYLRMALDCFTPEEYSGLQPEEVQLSFLSQTYCGDEVRVYKKQTDQGFYIEGRHGDKAIFHCILLCRA